MKKQTKTKSLRKRISEYLCPTREAEKQIKIWGIRAACIGDQIHCLPILDYLEEKYPNSKKYWVLADNCAQASPLYLNNPLIDTIRVENRDEGEDEKIKSQCDIVFNTWPENPDPTNWFNERHQIDHAILMAGIDPADVKDKHPRLVQWFDIEWVHKTIAIWPYSNHGKGHFGGLPWPDCPSGHWWHSLCDSLIDQGYEIIHLGSEKEPAIHEKAKNFRHKSFFDQIKISLGCTVSIGTDSGSAWVIGAYGANQIQITTNWWANHHKNPQAFMIKNHQNRCVNLFAVDGCDNVKHSDVEREIKRMEGLVN